MFQLPLTLTCLAIEPAPETGGPMILDCVVTDATGEEVRARGHMRVNVNAKSSFETLVDILQDYANKLSRDLLAQGKAERVEVDGERRAEQLEKLVGQSFTGVAK